MQLPAALGRARHLAEQGDDGPLPAGDRKCYFDSTKYKTYLDRMKAHFGCTYPMARPSCHQTSRVSLDFITRAGLSAGWLTCSRRPHGHWN
jgi:hypothetical protein